MSSLSRSIKISLIRSLIKLSNALGMKKNLTAKPKRFLVISTTGIGDTLWGTPAIRALKEAYPDCYTGVLTNPAGFELLKGNPDIDSLFIFRRGLKGFLALPELLKSLREKKFEVAFIFHSSDRVIWPLAFFTAAGRIIGVSGSSKGLDFILTDPLILPDKKLHGAEARLTLVKEAGASAKNKTIRIFLTDDEKDAAGRLLIENGLMKDSLIAGLHPGAQKQYKCWPPENFVALGNLLAEKFRCRIIVTGNAEERPLAAKIASGIQGAINVAGKLGLRETAALIEKMNLFITNDTGPMHIAFALMTPTIAMFGPTDPELCGPFEAGGRFRVISRPLTCDPCAGKNCTEPKCMGQITIEDVLKEAEYLLSSSGHSGLSGIFLRKDSRQAGVTDKETIR